MKRFWREVRVDDGEIRLDERPVRTPGRAPLAIGAWAQDRLPIPALFAIYPLPLLKAAAFGLLSAAAFSLAPLARARATPPASLFRADLAGTLSFGKNFVHFGVGARIVGQIDARRSISELDSRIGLRRFSREKRQDGAAHLEEGDAVVDAMPL